MQSYDTVGGTPLAYRT